MQAPNYLIRAHGDRGFSIGVVVGLFLVTLLMVEIIWKDPAYGFSVLGVLVGCALFEAVYLTLSEKYPGMRPGLHFLFRIHFLASFILLGVIFILYVFGSIGRFLGVGIGCVRHGLPRLETDA